MYRIVSDFLARNTGVGARPESKERSGRVVREERLYCFMLTDAACQLAAIHEVQRQADSSCAFQAGAIMGGMGAGDSTWRIGKQSRG